jgi:hypothetical protein
MRHCVTEQIQTPDLMLDRGLLILIQGFEERAHRFATRPVAVEDCLEGHLLDPKSHVAVIVAVGVDASLPGLLALPGFLDGLCDVGVAGGLLGSLGHGVAAGVWLCGSRRSRVRGPVGVLVASLTPSMHSWSARCSIASISLVVTLAQDPRISCGPMPEPPAALSARIYECARLTGEFRLRSGAVSHEYFDLCRVRHRSNYVASQVMSRRAWIARRSL